MGLKNVQQAGNDSLTTIQMQSRAMLRMRMPTHFFAGFLLPADWLAAADFFTSCCTAFACFSASPAILSTSVLAEAATL